MSQVPGIVGRSGCTQQRLQLLDDRLLRFDRLMEFVDSFPIVLHGPSETHVGFIIPPT